MTFAEMMEYGAQIIHNFATIPRLLMETEIGDTNAFAIVVGTSIGVYIAWIIAKWLIEFIT